MLLKLNCNVRYSYDLLFNFEFLSGGFKNVSCGVEKEVDNNSLLKS